MAPVGPSCEIPYSWCCWEFLVLLGIVGFGFVLTGLTYLTERKRTAIP